MANRVIYAFFSLEHDQSNRGHWIRRVSSVIGIQGGKKVEIQSGPSQKK